MINNISKIKNNQKNKIPHLVSEKKIARISSFKIVFLIILLYFNIHIE